jgi:thiol-disulfide isomerase/thioredoxin
MKKLLALGSLMIVVLLAACSPGVVETATSSTQLPEASLDNTPVTPTEAGMPPEWFAYPLVDVSSGETFTVADYPGRVVLVELMAMWCPTCLAQQAALKGTLDSLGNPAEIVTIVVDVDANERAEDLRAYVQEHDLEWKYAVATPEFARAISNSYGALYIQPPAAPMLLIDQDGEVHPLTAGYKNGVALLAVLKPFLAAK